MEESYLLTKPLYLDGEKETLVRIDGPSLEIRKAGSAARRFPLSRVSRLIASGNVLWQHEALLACLDHGVTVTFLAPDGAACGYGLPACDPATRDNQRIEEFLSRGDWQGLYSDWIRSYERREILHTLKLLGLRVADLRSPAVQEAIEGRLQQLAPLGFCRWTKNHLDGMLAARISEFVGQSGLAASVLVDRRPGFHFLRDAGRVLGWRLYGDAAVFLRAVRLRSRQEQESGCRPLLRRIYEANWPREARRIARYLDSFRFWLGGMR